VDKLEWCRRYEFGLCWEWRATLLGEDARVAGVYVVDHRHSGDHLEVVEPVQHVVADVAIACQCSASPSFRRTPRQMPWATSDNSMYN
jgi:hypothetical protein